MIRVAITDDHLMVLKGMTDLLEGIQDVTVVGNWLDVRTTREGMAQLMPDILFLDINLPDGDGVSLCKELTTEYPSLKIIALTTFNQTSYIRGMMDNGARGYLLKNTSQNEIQNAIREVVSGGNYLQQEVRQILEAGPEKSESKAPRLTRREKEVLVLICEEMTTNEIAEKLFLSAKTVETHRQHLLQKLEVRNIAGLVKAAINNGLLE